MEFVCTQCNTAYQVPEHKLPQRRALAKCKRCGAKVVIDPENYLKAEDQHQTEVSPADDGASEPQTESVAQATADQTVEDWTAFIGPKAEHYLKRFSKFGTPSKPHFALTWHWPAFLVGTLWLVYRKMYFWAAIALLLAIVPGVNLLSVFLWGALGHYLYWRHANRKIQPLRGAYPQDNLAITLAQIGGVHRWVVPVGVALGVLSVVVSLTMVR